MKRTLGSGTQGRGLGLALALVLFALLSLAQSAIAFKDATILRE